jgi:hypothetical protein
LSGGFLLNKKQAPIAECLSVLRHPEVIPGSCVMLNLLQHDV